ncbi:flagellar biosynthesis protein FlhB [bacterium CPR1]|nr:flagellar biosynthesis protein FlhB [bacterium CPR1]
MGGSDSDKTEEPTEHKLQEARKKGQVLKSQEIISTLLLLACYGVLLTCGKMMLARIIDYTKYIWMLIPTFQMNERNLMGESMLMMGTVLIVLAPLLASVFVMAILANVAQVKFLFTVEPLKPSLSKINPIEGFKRIFSMKSVMELVKQILKVAVIGWICYKCVKGELPKFAASPQMDLSQTIGLVKTILVRLTFQVLIGMTALSILDYLFQYKQFMKQMRMSMQELKDEYKDTEGNPQVKAKMRQLMRQGAQGRMMEEVPNSSAVVTNPTHLAIALKYETGVDPVPMVVAKGENLVAQQIKVKAEDHDVPIIENVELARTLFGACEVGQAIPTELYKAVAEVLAYVIKLKRKREMKRRRGKTGARR